MNAHARKGGGAQQARGVVEGEVPTFRVRQASAIGVMATAWLQRASGEAGQGHRGRGPTEGRLWPSSLLVPV